MQVGGRPDLGGMEQAFSAKVMTHLDYHFTHEYTFLPWESPQKTDKRRKRRKTSRRSENSVWGPWDLLPSDLLAKIMLKLDIIDYFAFSGVCRSWRLASIDSHISYMERQQPLVVVRPNHTKRSCILYNMFDGKEYKVMLPDLRGKPFVGLSSGYLITIDRNGEFWLVNLMTRHELRFPVLPQNLRHIDKCRYHSVLFQSNRRSKFFMVLFFRELKYLLLSESGSSSWQVYFFPETSAGISDVKIFDRKIFVLTCDALIGEFSPREDTVLKMHDTNIPIVLPPHASLQLVTSNNRLCMSISRYIYGWRQYLVLYELDHKKMECVKQILDLGSKSLFMSRFNSAVIDTSGWGAGNVVCVLEAENINNWTLYRLNGTKLAAAPVVWHARRWELLFWYFPQESRGISCVNDEFGVHQSDQSDQSA